MNCHGIAVCAKPLLTHPLKPLHAHSPQSSTTAKISKGNTLPNFNQSNYSLF